MRVVVVGAGHRGELYARFVKTYPTKMQVVGVVEPRLDVRQTFVKTYELEEECSFEAFEEFVDLSSKGKLADAVIICSPDCCHFDQTIAALDMGYHVLLEKPIAQSYDQCLAIAQKARQKSLIVGVCFPLRYHPVCLRVMQLVQQGSIGELIEINHTEYIGTERMVHNFVRGEWNTAERSGSLLLSKSCHDLDYIVALAGANCRQASSYGSLKWFRVENAPSGSAARCVDCAVEATCPYSAVKIYLREGKWLRHFSCVDRESIEHELRTSVFGKCVYRTDNDLWDNQVVAMQMENGVSVSFSLNAFTLQTKRRTHLMGSQGEILVDENFDKIVLRKFLDNSQSVEDFSDLPEQLHAGADWVIIEKFIEAVATGDAQSLSISIDRAIESHRIALMSSTL